MRRKSRFIAVAIAMVLGLLADPALAFDWDVQATVTMVEASYMPSKIVFSVNAPAGTCAQGALLGWTAQGTDEAQQIANAEAVFSLLLTAKMSNKTIEIYGYNSGCAVAFIHIIN